MKKHLAYARYVWRHKVAVFKAGRRLGVPLWRLLVHDLSKLRPDEWRAYAEWFYGYQGGSWYALKKQQREHPTWAGPYALMIQHQAAFNRAWNLHQKRNDHHWQFWLLTEDSGKEMPLVMSEAALLEMLADWMGAGMAIRGHGLDRAPDETRAWYVENEERMRLADWTRQTLESMLFAVPRPPKEKVAPVG